MTSAGKLVGAMIVVGALGVAWVPVARAQTHAPAYVVAEVEITDPAGFAKYAAQVPATLAPFGGRYLVRGGSIKAVEGSPPRTFVVLAFDSLEQAEGWDNSPAYRAIQPLRVKSTSAASRVFIAEGLAPK